MNFEELDDATRRYIFEEFDREEAENHLFREKGLSVVGWAEFSGLIRNAMHLDNEEAFIASY
jgi:hypothetical protein